VSTEGRLPEAKRDDALPAPPDEPGIIEAGHTFATLTDKISSIVLKRRTPLGWLVGFAISFALLTAFIVRVMCAEKLRTALVVAIVGSAGFYALFEWALDLSLPKGMLF